jgi:hypothetical protein
MNQDEPERQRRDSTQTRRRGRLDPTSRMSESAPSMTCRAVGEFEEVGRRLQAGDLQWRFGPALTLTAEGDEAVMGWDWQVRQKERSETRQTTWAKGPRGTASFGSADHRSTSPVA